MFASHVDYILYAAGATSGNTEDWGVSQAGCKEGAEGRPEAHWGHQEDPCAH